MKMFSKSATETWQMVARAQFIFPKQRTEIVKEALLPLYPHKFMNLPPSLKKWHALSKAIVIFAKVIR